MVRKALERYKSVLEELDYTREKRAESLSDIIGSDKKVTRLS